jgi:hypothetical protein
LNNEIRDALERGDSDDRKGEAKKGMRRVYNGDRMAYLIRHCGIIIGVLFYRLNERPSTPISWSGP